MGVHVSKKRATSDDVADAAAQAMLNDATPGVSHRLTPAECAERARVSVSLIYAWCRRGALAHYRLGQEEKRGKIVINKDDFDAFLEKLKVSGPPQEDKEEDLTFLK